MNWFKRNFNFKLPTVNTVAEEMLNDAEKALLTAFLAKEHWDAEVTKLQITIRRLEQRRKGLNVIDKLSK